eukprot:2412641-Pleurochrysis_carterae.AAC.3
MAPISQQAGSALAKASRGASQSIVIARNFSYGAQTYYASPRCLSIPQGRGGRRRACTSRSQRCTTQ